MQFVLYVEYTEKKANSLGVRGWCVNTPNDTVKGQIEATTGPFEEMLV